MLLTMAMNWAGEGVVIASVAYGAGRHIGDVDPAVFQTGMKLNFITQPIFLIAICVVKLSVGCALLRIASTKFYRWLILGIMIFMSIYTIGCFFVSHISHHKLEIANMSRRSYSNVQTFAPSGILWSLVSVGLKTHYRVYHTQTLPSTS